MFDPTIVISTLETPHPGDPCPGQLLVRNEATEELEHLNQ